MPLIFPRAGSLEDIFNNSSREKISKVFREKPETKISTTLKTFFVKARRKKVRASNRAIKSKNLYPPIFLNTFGARINARMDKSDPRT
jgi:hypothetical protein